MRHIISAFVLAVVAIVPSAGAEASAGGMMQVYRGPTKFPDFTGRDRAYSKFRTKIVEEMKTGPNFAGHFAIVEIGCGTSCRFVIVADVATGALYQFPYGGEDFYGLWLNYGVKDNGVEAQWTSEGRCIKDSLIWEGNRFRSTNRRVVGDERACDL